MADINSCNARWLVSKAGISPQKAQKIVKYRRREAKIHSFNELRNIAGVSRQDIQKLKKSCTIKKESVTSTPRSKRNSVKFSRKVGVEKSSQTKSGIGDNDVNTKSSKSENLQRTPVVKLVDVMDIDSCARQGNQFSPTKLFTPLSIQQSTSGNKLTAVYTASYNAPSTSGYVPVNVDNVSTTVNPPSSSRSTIYIDDHRSHISESKIRSIKHWLRTIPRRYLSQHIPHKIPSSPGCLQRETVRLLDADEKQERSASPARKSVTPTRSIKSTLKTPANSTSHWSSSTKQRKHVTTRSASKNKGSPKVGREYRKMNRSTSMTRPRSRSNSEMRLLTRSNSKTHLRSRSNPKTFSNNRLKSKTRSNSRSKSKSHSKRRSKSKTRSKSRSKSKTRSKSRSKPKTRSKSRSTSMTRSKAISPSESPIIDRRSMSPAPNVSTPPARTGNEKGRKPGTEASMVKGKTMFAKEIEKEPLLNTMFANEMNSDDRPLTLVELEASIAEIQPDVAPDDNMQSDIRSISPEPEYSVVPRKGGLFTYKYERLRTHSPDDNAHQITNRRHFEERQQTRSGERYLSQTRDVRSFQKSSSHEKRHKSERRRRRHRSHDHHHRRHHRQSDKHNSCNIL